MSYYRPAYRASTNQHTEPAQTSMLSPVEVCGHIGMLRYQSEAAIPKQATATTEQSDHRLPKQDASMFRLNLAPSNQYASEAKHRRRIMVHNFS